MKTYDDVQGFGRVGMAAISHLGLFREARALNARGEAWELWRTHNHNGQNVEVLWVPGPCRAGVARGGDAAWTDASGPKDALERYFGIDGKEMCE